MSGLRATMAPLEDPRLDPMMEDEGAIDLRHYWRVLMRFKWGIVGLGVLTAVLAAIILLGMDDVYESRATLLIETNQPRISTIEELYGMPSQSREYYSTQFELLKNRTLAERVINELNLRGHRDFQPEEPSGFNLKAFIKGLLPAADEGVQASLVSAEEREQARLLNVFNSKLTI